MLKPCPFCGGIPEKRVTNLDERFAYAKQIIYQCQCGCSRGSTGDSIKGGYADNSTVEQRALAAWNTRYKEEFK